MKYFIAFSYFGKNYHGWQRQPNAVSVQQLMEEHFSTLVRKPISLVAAGRTDAGVHARSMIAHFELEGVEINADLIHKLNAFLPEDIAVQSIVPVRDEAHARFDAISRTYEYWVVQKKDPFYEERAHFVRTPLDVDTMNAAAALLLEHDNFECFSKTHTDVKTFICKIAGATWTSDSEKLVFTITADRFLRNMVRAVVGTLLEVGIGKLQPKDVKTIIKSKDRSLAGPSVPAKGLYLTEVVYPESIYLLDGSGNRKGI